jgi:hypothetical protein
LFPKSQLENLVTLYKIKNLLWKEKLNESISCSW